MAETLPSTDPPRTCLNCATVLVGAFCHGCGQKGSTGRLNWTWLLRSFLDRVLSYDGALWQTIGGLILRPGETCLRYISGQRVRYVDPLKYFAFGLIIEVVLELILGNPLKPFEPAMPTNAMEKALDSRVVQLLLVLLQATFLALLFRRSGFTLIEQQVFTLYVMTQVNLTYVLLLFVLAALPNRLMHKPDLDLFMLPIISGGYLIVAGWRFYEGQRLWTTLKLLMGGGAMLLVPLLLYRGGRFLFGSP